MQQIDYDAHGKLHFRPEDALFRDGPGVYPVTFVFLGKFFPKSVRMYALEGGQSRARSSTRPTTSRSAEDSPARQLPPDANGFAGFWLRESRLEGEAGRREEPWATFLGASYFRAVGELGQVGMSARGVAINVADPEPEEFPDFVAHWISPAAKEGDPVVVHSLLDGPSLAGAYRFAIRRTTGVVMEIENRLFLRKDVKRLGIAPLTSMFWYAEYGRERQADWRPEVHDADGLAMWTGAGERIWRPLNNPTRIFITTYSDDDPRGFGLSQRDRNFDHYLDGVGYEKRPTAWIEPLAAGARATSSWSRSRPTMRSTTTSPPSGCPRTRPRPATRSASATASPGSPPSPASRPNLAKVVATRTGRGGQPGKPRPHGVTKFTVEFLGGELRALPYGVRPEPVISVSRGQVSLVQVEAGAGRRARPLARSLRPHGRRPRPGRHAPLPPPRRHRALRDLALFVRAAGVRVSALALPALAVSPDRRHGRERNEAVTAAGGSCAASSRLTRYGTRTLAKPIFLVE